MLESGWGEPQLTFVSEPEECIKDFVVEKVGDDNFEAYFCSGPIFQELRTVMSAKSKTPTGLWTDIKPFKIHQQHTRIYKSRIDHERELITAVWPGLPKTGVWLSERFTSGLSLRRLLISPVEGTLCSVDIANPSCIKTSDGFEIFLEGRSEEDKWRIFYAIMQYGTWHVSLNTNPLMEGQNPYVACFDVFRKTYYLYYQVWNSETRRSDVYVRTRTIPVSER